MQVPVLEDGLEAVVFTADGDMRQALNNLQATATGSGLVDQAAVFKARAHRLSVHTACPSPCPWWLVQCMMYSRLHTITQCQGLD